MIKLTDDEIFILGRPNFACAHVAKLLIKAGVYEDKAQKAEYEQAVFIHWASGLLEKHGSDWKRKSQYLLDDLYANTEGTLDIVTQDNGD